MFIQTIGLKKSFTRGDQPVNALAGVSIDIRKGEFVSIMGPSGSGKSTLLHLIGALDRPTGGSIRIDGQALESMSDDELSRFRRQRLGFIFQFFNLLPTLSALENVALPRLLDGKSMNQVSGRARELLTGLGLEKRLNHHPDQLSGGEMQRVAIARALIADPLLVLADEPTGNLDSQTGIAVLESLSRVVKESGKTLIMVTHDSKAAAYADRIIRLRDGLLEN